MIRLDDRARHVAAVAVVRLGVEHARRVAENAEADPAVRAAVLRLLERHGDQVPARLERRTYRSWP